MRARKKKIAMVVKGWPRLSESFIAQEVLALDDAVNKLHSEALSPLDRPE